MHELELLRSAGLPDEAILAAATSAAADMIGSYAIAAIWKNGHAVDRRPKEVPGG